MTRDKFSEAITAAMCAAGETVMQWGRDDCVLWCANIVREVCGYDPVPEIRGRYRSRRGALRLIGRRGLLRPMRATARWHKWARIDPRLAQPGDVGLVRVQLSDGEIFATVICRARGWFVGRNERGFTAMRADRVAYAWSVLPDALSIAAPRAALPALRPPWRPPMSAAHHEPISTFIGLTALIEGLGASAAVAGAIGGAIVTTVVVAGLQVANSLLSRGAAIDNGVGLATSMTSATGSTADVSPVASTQVTERQSLPSKRVIVGSAYVGGALFFEQVKPPYLTQGILISDGPITSVETIFIGTDQLSFSAITPGTIMTPLAVDGQPDYPDNLLVSVRLGADDQILDPLIQLNYPEVDSSFQQRGIATAVYRYAFGADQNAFLALWGNVARPTAYTVVKGVAVYDPRDDTQSLDDETTWKWSNNASLVQAYYLMQPWGGRIPKEKIRWDKVATSADYDDTTMACADGSNIARHTIDGAITLNQQPYQVLQDLLTANRGMVLQSGGDIWVESSQPKTPIATIYDRILTDGITYQSAKQKSDLVNKLQVRFVAPSQDYQVVDGPILDRTDLQAIDGEVLPATLALNYTQDDRRAQRLQKAFLESSRLGRSITCSVLLNLLATAADELIGNVVTVDSQLFPSANGDYMVTSVTFSDDCTSATLALTEYDASIETDWNPSTDEQPFTLADIDVS